MDNELRLKVMDILWEMDQLDILVVKKGIDTDCAPKLLIELGELILNYPFRSKRLSKWVKIMTELWLEWEAENDGEKKGQENGTKEKKEGNGDDQAPED